MATNRTPPYWLAGGTESCALCSHPHVREHEYRCAACDRANCEHCITIDRETGEILCHACAEEGGEGEG